jgi:molecular chaperone GrpE
MNTTNDRTEEQSEARLDEAPTLKMTADDPVAEWKGRVEKLEDQLLRAKADFQNLQKRTAADRLDAIRYANADLMRTFVKVLDDFDRALAAAKESQEPNPLLEGIRLVRENFVKAMAESGLETIDALHQPFDPSIHEALMQVPTNDHPPGTVVEQHAKGYRLHGRVVRPAKVIVSKAVESPSNE